MMQWMKELRCLLPVRQQGPARARQVPGKSPARWWCPDAAAAAAAAAVLAIVEFTAKCSNYTTRSISGTNYELQT